MLSRCSLLALPSLDAVHEVREGLREKHSPFLYFFFKFHLWTTPFNKIIIRHLQPVLRAPIVWGPHSFVKEGLFHALLVAITNATARSPGRGDCASPSTPVPGCSKGTAYSCPLPSPLPTAAALL